MKPVCAKCRRFFRIKKTGFYFIEGMPVGTGAPPGLEAPERWKPYKIWSGDLWECKGCGAEIVSGFGNEPVSIQHQQDFGYFVKTLKADQLQVNDC